MPELPEVETVRRRLAPVLGGARIVEATILDARLTRPHDPLLVAAELVGERVAAVERRGKYLVVRFESGRSLLVHLRMTGSFRIAPASRTLGPPDATAPSAGSPPGAHRPDAHLRAVLVLDNAAEVTFRDVRRFGTWELLEPGEAEDELARRLGPEPLGPISAAGLRARLEGRRSPLKSALLDQRVVAGLGNIYVDEALWRARLHPLRPAGSLTAAEARALHRAVRGVLRQAIERQGSTLRDYVGPDGAAGTMQEEFRAYGREGVPCERCGRPLVRTVVGGRGTTFCASCQRR